jgi:hypothetical protein
MGLLSYYFVELARHELENILERQLGRVTGVAIYRYSLSVDEVRNIYLNIITSH